MSSKTDRKKAAPSAPTKPAASGTPKIVWILGGVVLVALFVGIAFGGGGGASAEFGEPTVAGDPLPPYGSAAEDPAYGLVPPTVDGNNFDGEIIEIVPGGTPKAIVFLAHWCPHCQNEVPAVQAWLDAGGDTHGVEIIAVASGTSSARVNFPPSAWLEREGWTSPVILDDTDGSAARAYGLSGFPFWTFMDADGKVVYRSAGASDINALAALFEAVGNGEL